METNTPNKEPYELLQTKVSPEFKRIFTALCQKKGLSTYTVMQMMADTFVRYTDDRHNLSPEMSQLMTIFEHMIGWGNALNLADHTATKEIEEAVYVITAEHRKGCRCVLVERPFFGDWSETANVQTILERLFERLCPEIYRRLRALAVDMECSSILELINLMLDAHTIEQLNAEYRQPFEDARRHDFGRKIEYGQRTKRKHHKGIDIFDRQDTAARAQAINAALDDPEDEPDDTDEQEPTADPPRDLNAEQSTGHALDDELEQRMGFKPFGSEW